MDLVFRPHLACFYHPGVVPMILRCPVIFSRVPILMVTAFFVSSYLVLSSRLLSAHGNLLDGVLYRDSRHHHPLLPFGEQKKMGTLHVFKFRSCSRYPLYAADFQRLQPPFYATLAVDLLRATHKKATTRQRAKDRAHPMSHVSALGLNTSVSYGFLPRRSGLLRAVGDASNRQRSRGWRYRISFSTWRGPCQ